jgi:tripartite-type tricarboxylate transporter receptor subunit TctC
MHAARVHALDIFPRSDVMKLPRRKFLSLTAGLTALPATSRLVWALDYPTRPVHLIVGYYAGSLSDVSARLAAQSLSERLGQQVVVDNRPGAGSNIATELVVRASPDGYSLLLIATPAAAVNVTLYENLNFNFLRDIAPVATISRTPGVMALNPSFPAQTVPEFIAYAKSNPGKINYASAGIGSLLHVSAELFKFMTDVDLVHVPYHGNYMPDLLAGQVQLAFATLPSAIEFIRAGKLRALAVTGATRSDVLPDVPTVSEFVPGYESESWNGIGAPKNTPIEIVEKLNTEINAAFADPAVRAKIIELGSKPQSMTPAEFGKLMADETTKWAKVVKFANMKPE